MILDTNFHPVLRLLIAGAVLMLAGCGSTDRGLADPGWTPPAESREVAALSETAAALAPDLSLRGRLSEGCELNYAAYPDVFGLNVESLVAELGDGPIPWAEIKRRATPALQEPADGCSGHSPDHRAAVAIAGGCAVCDETDGQRVPRWLEELMWYDTCDSGSRAWLARSRVLRHYNSCTGDRQTVCPSLPLTPPDCERWRAALDDSRGQYYHCADPEVHTAKDILCATSDPCPGWSRDWPPPGGEESCTHWVPRDIQCGYSASPFVSGAVCNERRKSGEEPPPPPGPVCGDGTCDHDETQASCPVDCGTPPPPPPPPSGDCDLSPVVQRQDALAVELQRLADALADLPAPICPKPVCHPAPCRLDCDCPAPCPDVDCGDGGTEPPDPTDPPPPPTGEFGFDVTHRFGAGNDYRGPLRVPEDGPAPRHVLINVSATSPGPAGWPERAQVVYACAYIQPGTVRKFCAIYQENQDGWELHLDPDKTQHRPGRTLEWTGTWQLPPGGWVQVDLGIRREVSHHFDPRGGEVRVRVSEWSAALMRSSDLDYVEPVHPALVRWGEGVEP